MQANAAGVAEVFDVTRRNARLAVVLAKQEVSEPYAGQIFSRFWAIGHPLFLMALYAVVFSVVFDARIGGTHDLPLDYTVYILSGLVPWLTFQAAMTKGSQAITQNASLVKQVVFPLEVLPIKTALAALVVLAIGSAFIVLYTLVVARTILWTYLLFPYLVFVQVVAMIGVCFALSATAALVRDVREFVSLFSVANIFFMPVIYLPAWMPTVFKPVIFINPFSYLVWCYQDVFYFGRIEHPLAWVISTAGSFVTLGVGYRVFRRLKQHFGDVL